MVDLSPSSQGDSRSMVIHAALAEIGQLSIKIDDFFDPFIEQNLAKFVKSHIDSVVFHQ